MKYGPKIITDGLVLCLDAADRNSYPGSGASWFDLSGNNNHGTLMAGPTFDSSNGGSIVFDGSDDYVDCGNGSSINIIDNLSVNIWFKITKPFGVFQGILAKRTGTANYGFNFATSAMQWYFRASSSFRVCSVSMSNFPIETWHNITGTFEKNGLDTLAKIYKNGVLLKSQSLQENVGTADVALSIGKSGTAAEYFGGHIPSVQIYNRALSFPEIFQNYKMMKGRYNL